jgi:hypothetical protein
MPQVDREEFTKKGYFLRLDFTVVQRPTEDELARMEEASAKIDHSEVSGTEADRDAAFAIDAQPPIAWGTRTFTTEAAAALGGALEERGLGGMPPLAELPGSWRRVMGPYQLGIAMEPGKSWEIGGTSVKGALYAYRKAEEDERDDIKLHILEDEEGLPVSLVLLSHRTGEVVIAFSPEDRKAAKKLLTKAGEA